MHCANNKKPQLLLTVNDATAATAHAVCNNNNDTKDSSNNKQAHFANLPEQEGKITNGEAVEKMTVVDNNLFKSLPLDATELIPSFLNDKELLRDSMTILTSCQMMLKASEGLCEKIYQQVLAGVAGTNRGSFE
jgi:hypothetical protein